MAYGMTYEQFWQGDPWMVKAFEQAHLLKQRMRNEQMWIQGAYIANAVTVAINNCLSKHKIDYLKKPLDIYPKTEAEEREEVRKEKLQVIAYFNALKANMNAKKGTDQDDKP